MKQDRKSIEMALVERIIAGDQSAAKEIEIHYRDIIHYKVQQILDDEAECEKVLSIVFSDVWEGREVIEQFYHDPDISFDLQWLMVADAETLAREISDTKKLQLLKDDLHNMLKLFIKN